MENDMKQVQLLSTGVTMTLNTDEKVEHNTGEIEGCLRTETSSESDSTSSADEELQFEEMFERGGSTKESAHSTPRASVSSILTMFLMTKFYKYNLNISPLNLRLKFCSWLARHLCLLLSFLRNPECPC